MPTLTTNARDAACNAIVDLVDAGAGAGTLVFETSGDVAVATITLQDPAFGNSSTGVATLLGVPLSDTDADSTNTIAKASLYDSTPTKVLELTCGVGSGDISMSSLSVTAGDTVTISSLTITVPA